MSLVNGLATIEYGIAKPDVPAGNIIDSSWRLAQYAAKSGIARQKNEYDAFFIIMYGYELGISPMAALRTIYSVEGTPTCSGEAMLALIRKSRLAEKIDIKQGEDKAVVFMKRRDTGEEYTATFSLQDAERAGLKGKFNWKGYPKKMMMWRAISECAKVLFGDVIGGLYTVEEMAPDTPVNEAGEPVGKIIITKPDGTPIDDPQVTSNEKVEEGEIIEHPPVIKLADWLTVDDAHKRIDYIVATAHNAIPDIDDDALFKLAGVKSKYDLDGWSKYAGGKEAGQAILDAWKATQKPAEPKAATEPKADSPIGEKPAEQPKTPPTPAIVWTEADSVEFAEVLARHDLDSAELLKLAKLNAWSEIAPKAAKVKVAALMAEHHLPFIADQLIYVKEGEAKQYLIFNAMLWKGMPPIAVRMYGRDRLRDLGEDWAVWAETLVGGKPGKVYKFDEANLSDLRVAWKSAEGYNEVVFIEPLFADDGEAVEEDYQDVLDKFLNEEVVPTV